MFWVSGGFQSYKITNEEESSEPPVMDADQILGWAQASANIIALIGGGVIWRIYTTNLKAQLETKGEQVETIQKHLDFWKDKSSDLENRSPERFEQILNERINIREQEIQKLSDDQETNKAQLLILSEEKSVLKNELERNKEYKRRLNFIGEDFDDFFFAREGDLEVVNLGEVGVDSGQLMITDPCYIDSEWKQEEYDDVRIYKDPTSNMTYQFRKDFYNYQDVIEDLGDSVNSLVAAGRLVAIIDSKRDFNYSYAGASKASLSTEGYGELKYRLGHTGAGVAFGTALGDGVYQVYGEKYDDKLIRVYVNVI